jgi:hypothetical protein
MRAGAKAVIQVKFSNVSRTDIVLGFDDVLHSYFYTVESSNEIEFQGLAEAGVGDCRVHCPGDVPTFLLRSGQTLIQLISVPVPKKAHGMATLQIGLRVIYFREAPRCGAAVLLDVPASGAGRITSIGERRP